MKIFTLFLFTLISLFGYAQANINFVGGFNDAEILFIDGHTEKGEVSEFLTNPKIGTDYIESYNFKDYVVEEFFDATDKKFTFKDVHNNRRTISSDSVKRLKISKFGSTYEFGYFKIKKINEEFEIMEKEQKAWLPYIKKGPVSILGFSVMNEKGVYYATYIYLKKETEDVAYISSNIGLLFPFIRGESKDKVIVLLKELFKDCDVTLA